MVQVFPRRECYDMNLVKIVIRFYFDDLDLVEILDSKGLHRQMKLYCEVFRCVRGNAPVHVM